MSKFVDDKRVKELVRQNPDVLIRHLDSVLTQEQVDSLNSLLEQKDVEHTYRRMQEFALAMGPIVPDDVLSAYNKAVGEYASLKGIKVKEEDPNDFIG